MAPERVERRLAAVLAADVAGYSRLMGTDEEGTLARLKAARKDLIDPTIAAHRGRIVKTTGDGMLVEFGSVVDAVRSSVEVQDRIAELNASAPQQHRIAFRIGIHVGDIMIDNDDIFGDGVNIAARLENIADPGGICLSDDAYRQIRGKVDAAFEDIGQQNLKNIAEPVRVWRMKIGAKASTAHLATSTEPHHVRPLSRKPSIAVLPFQNMSGDIEQEYFADGIAEDVLTTLSKIQELMVIARNSSFAFKGQNRDIREIGQILGARYLLEGSVRKLGNRVRLTAQLIDSRDGSHLWADRFDGELDDVFDLQDRITREIVEALEVQLTVGERARVWRKRSGSPLAYEYVLKGRALYVNFARQTHAQGRKLLEEALEINPAFMPALYLLGLTLTDQARFGWAKDEDEAYQAALDCADRALAVDPGFGEAYLVIGYVRTFQRRHDEAVTAGEAAISLVPSSSDAHHMAGMYHGYAGNFRKAVLYEEHAQRLSPIERNESMVDEARARFHLGDFATAHDIASRVLKQRPLWLTAQSTLIAALWNLGRQNEARVISTDLLAGHPNFSLARWASLLPYRRQGDLDALVNPLRMAGLPE
ncbi:adenylate/guanylate cyclase domain-containing protein [Bradyrhizobium sp. RD5-C2]|uniref:adenylate/guanylate cyclase domain-containing protein n=1 Tax=Bradyrhizobium sp. RD5-C2 TaxID=244562 RepID=UPI001CC3CCC0|nr:adenylate/guanylate cyclase domain-containing protein [Bradyrhizobium sp. RD5-C2]GIQ79003.1 guanylyl cyclase [Bradyrhizobium sp. RD5-C2]